MTGDEEVNIGVIGGSDGPTAIYVASSFHWGFVIGAAIVIAGIVIAFLVRKKKK